MERVDGSIDDPSARCDGNQSSVETGTDVARIARDGALRRLAGIGGPNHKSRCRVDAHGATPVDPVPGALPWRLRFVPLRQSTGDGDVTRRRGVTRGDGPESFRIAPSARSRGGHAFAGTERSIFSIATGASGHPGSGP
jgi:hypothetical protein